VFSTYRKEPVMAKKKEKMTVAVLLDRSGSMEECRDTTIDAYNEYIKGLTSAKALTVSVSLTLFDSEGIDLLYGDTPVKKVPKLDREAFVPRALTPLYDAIGKTIHGMKKSKGKITFVILTDGMENASKEYNREAVRKLLLARQEEDGWLVVYLGANQDGWGEGMGLGVRSGNAMTYGTGNVKESFAMVGRVSASYGKSGLTHNTNFTDDERTRAVK
jgi:Mg-chelatase subunit ChlD